MPKPGKKKHAVRHVIDAAMRTPWAIDLRTLQAIREVLELRASGAEFTADEIRSRIGAARGLADEEEERQEAYALTPDGIAVIPLYGVLAPRMNLMMEISGGTSTSEFTRAVRQAAADPDVRAILLDVDSPGGNVLGIEEAAQALRAAAEKKTVEAVGTHQIASAAYYIGSAATRLSASPSTEVGSVGVYTLHVDRSEAFKKAGVKHEFIQAGQFKTDGNQYEPLSKQGRATLQEEVDAYYEQMVRSIALGRKVDEATVRDKFGGGKVLIAERAVAAGMADRVATLDDVLAELGRKLKESQARTAVTFPSQFPRGETMDKRVLEALVAAGLVAADANEGLAKATLQAWYAGRRQNMPDKVEQILADLKAGTAREREETQVDRAVAAGSASVLSQETVRQVLAAAPTPAAPTPAATAAAAQAERERITQIQARGRILSVAEETIEAAVNNGTSLAGFLDETTRNMAAREKPVHEIRGVDSERDKFQEAAATALARRANVGRDKPISGVAKSLEYASLLRIAEQSIRIQGGRAVGDPDTIASAALGDPTSLRLMGADVPYGGAAEFPLILSALANKVLEAAPPYVSTTYQYWAYRRGPLPDFKPQNLVKLGEFGEFPLVPEGDDFTQSTFSSQHGYIAVDQYGDEFALTPRMVLNDDLNAFTEALTDKQAAHDQTLNRLCVNLLVGNPTCVDGNALFDDTNHGNDVASGGAAPDTTELNKFRLRLRKQTGVSGKRKLNYTLYGLLVPEDLETTTQQLLDATLAMVAVTSATTNPYKGKVTWWVEPMLGESSAKKYYGFANPAAARAIVYAHQVGFETMKRRNYFNPKNNSQMFQFEGRFAAAIADWRGVCRTKGEA